MCTLLSNQRGLVRDSYALRIGLLTHVFLRVMPLPRPPSGEGGGGEGGGGDLQCFWAGATMSADTQANMIRWLGTLCRHFAAASLAVPLGRSFDAARMLVFSAIAALVDAVLRVKASDAPTALSLHYGGHVAGAAGAFALDMRHLEHESETGQLLQPRFAAARTMVLDYFRAISDLAPPERYATWLPSSRGVLSCSSLLARHTAPHLLMPRVSTTPSVSTTPRASACRSACHARRVTLGCHTC